MSSRRSVDCCPMSLTEYRLNCRVRPAHELYRYPTTQECITNPEAGMMPTFGTGKPRLERIRRQMSRCPEECHLGTGGKNITRRVSRHLIRPPVQDVTSAASRALVFILGTTDLYTRSTSLDWSRSSRLPASHVTVAVSADETKKKERPPRPLLGTRET